MIRRIITKFMTEVVHLIRIKIAYKKEEEKILFSKKSNR